jgi:hypothetical protein
VWADRPAGSVPCYKFGELKLLEPRLAAEEALGPKLDIRAFHDAILGNGQLPLDVLERLVKSKQSRGGGADRGASHDSRQERVGEAAGHTTSASNFADHSRV